MAEAKPSKSQRRLLARGRQRAERKRRTLRRWMAIAVALAGALGLATWAVIAVVTRGSDEPPEVAAAVSQRYRVDDEGREHTTQGAPITYKHYPPSSGSHYPQPSAYGVFTEPVPEGAWVHNLEHGGIVVLFKCVADCEVKAGEIRPIYDRLPKGAFGEVKLLAAPYDRGLTDYTLLGWGWQEDLEMLDPARVERFYRDLLDKGPENAA